MPVLHHFLVYPLPIPYIIIMYLHVPFLPKTTKINIPQRVKLNTLRNKHKYKTKNMHVVSSSDLTSTTKSKFMSDIISRLIKHLNTSKTKTIIHKPKPFKIPIRTKRAIQPNNLDTNSRSLPRLNGVSFVHPQPLNNMKPVPSEVAALTVSATQLRNFQPGNANHLSQSMLGIPMRTVGSKNILMSDISAQHPPIVGIANKLPSNFPSTNLPTSWRFSNNANNFQQQPLSVKPNTLERSSGSNNLKFDFGNVGINVFAQSSDTIPLDISSSHSSSFGGKTFSSGSRNQMIGNSNIDSGFTQQNTFTIPTKQQNPFQSHDINTMAMNIQPAPNTINTLPLPEHHASSSFLSPITYQPQSSGASQIPATVAVTQPSSLSMPKPSFITLTQFNNIGIPKIIRTPTKSSAIENKAIPQQTLFSEMLQNIHNPIKSVFQPVTQPVPFHVQPPNTQMPLSIMGRTIHSFPNPTETTFDAQSVKTGFPSVGTQTGTFTSSSIKTQLAESINKGQRTEGIGAIQRGVPPLWTQPQQPMQQPIQQSMQQPIIPPRQRPIIPHMQLPIIRHMQQPIIPPMQQPIIPPMQQPTIPSMQQPIQQPMQHPIIPPMQQPIIPHMQQPIIPPMQQPIIPPTQHPTIQPSHIHVPTIITQAMRAGQSGSNNIMTRSQFSNQHFRRNQNSFSSLSHRQFRNQMHRIPTFPFPIGPPSFISGMSRPIFSANGSEYPHGEGGGKERSMSGNVSDD